MSLSDKYDVVLKNGTVVSSKTVSRMDVGITGGTIAALGKDLSGKQEIEAEDKLITPGAVDMHVHLQMPLGFFTSSDDFFTGTRAAAFGGTTTVVDFVQPEKEESLLRALAARRAEADPKVVIDYGLHMTIGPDESCKLDQVADAFRAGTKGFKVYMAYDLCLDDGQLLQAFEAIARVGGLSIVHAENWKVIQFLSQRFIASGFAQPQWHPVSRPPLFEGEAANRVIALAEYTGVPLHIFHISCASAAAAVKAAKQRGVPVTGETCPQYLFLTDEEYRRAGVDGALAVCSPPLRSLKEQKSLWKALSDGYLQIISTDHCPFTIREKASGLERFDCIPGGLPSIEMRFSALYSEGVKKGLLSLSQWIQLCCTNPAELLGYRNKGDIAVGFDADLVIFDPNKEVEICPEILHEAAGWTPYRGLKIQGWPESVFSRGNLIVDKGKFLGEQGLGKFINPCL